MIKQSALVILVLFCVSCRDCLADDAVPVLERAGRSFSGHTAYIELNRRDGAWYIAGVSLSIASKEISESDLQPLVGQPHPDSVQSVELQGYGRVPPKVFQKLSVLRNLKQLRIRLAMPSDGLETIATLKELVALELSFDEEIGVTSMSQLAKLPNLRKLSLCEAGLTNTAMEDVKTFKALEILNLSGNGKVTDAGLVKLEGLTSLRELDLVGTAVTGVGIAGLKRVPTLERLCIGRNEPAEAAPLGRLDLSAWTSLTSVSLGDGLAKEAREVRLPEHLRFLSLSTRAAEAMGYERLPRQIESIRVRMNAYGAIDLKWLGFFSRLAELELVERADAALKSTGSLESLRALRLEAATEPITDDGAKRVSQWQHLERLEIATAAKLTRVGLNAIGRMTELRRLELTGIGDVSPEAMAFLGQLKRLESVSLSEFRSGTQAAQADLWLVHLQRHDQLRELVLKGAVVTDEGLQKLSELKSLRRLDLSNCRGFTDRGLGSLMNALPNLEMVKISYEPSGEKP
jgi:hypothetical protein